MQPEERKVHKDDEVRSPSRSDVWRKTHRPTPPGKTSTAIHTPLCSGTSAAGPTTKPSCLVSAGTLDAMDATSHAAAHKRKRRATRIIVDDDDESDDVVDVGVNAD